MGLTIALLVCATGIIGTYLLYRCFLLESPARLAPMLLLSPLFLLGILIRKPIVAWCEWLSGSFIAGQPLFFELGTGVSLILLFMAPVIEELLKGTVALCIVLFVLRSRSAAASPPAILEAAATVGFGFGLMEAVFLAVRSANLLNGIAIVGFSVERILVAAVHAALTSIFLFHAFALGSGDGRLGWRTAGRAIALVILLHAMLNASIVLMTAPERHAVLRTIAIPYLIIAFAVVFLFLAAIYVRIEKLARSAVPRSGDGT